MSRNDDQFDESAGVNWIYPSNLPLRDYQYNIVKNALFKNTLVCLPTGLGKTFIAAVVMYNFYRWYPSSKIIFMTPTRPLVAQQIDACYHVMGIPQEAMTEMTGTQSPAVRAEMWKTKQIFFLTPQVLMNDIGRGVCNGSAVRCLVIDEAHRAQKNHSYCQVVREISRLQNQFRVLALSATPGNDLKDVQQVISNILISHVEIRSEESIDVLPYTHQKLIDKIVVSLGDNLSNIVQKYLQICSTYVLRLQQNRVLFSQAPEKITKFMLLKAREKFRETSRQLPPALVGRNESDFVISMCLYQGLELAQLHGPRSLYNFMQGYLHGDKAIPRVRNEFLKNALFMELFEELASQFDPNRQTEDDARPDSHPKMKKLDEVILKHFMDCLSGENNTPKESRVIVFAQYRDTCDEIKRLLERHRPLVKPVVFIGHGSSSSSEKSKTKAKSKPVKEEVGAESEVSAPGRLAGTKMSQKEQLQIMERFRIGDYNTLVATSIVEEGLDIGEVDLIICYDQLRSPIRLVQRMGRTGRKRNGRCVMLVTEGKEDQIYEQGQKKRRALIKSIENAKSTLQLYQGNVRMVPDHLKPEVIMKEVKAPGGPLKVGPGAKGKGRSVVSTKSSWTAKALSSETKPDYSAVKHEVDAESNFEEESRPVTSSNAVEEVSECEMTVKSKTKRKQKKVENTRNTDSGNKQRKVYEFFAAPATPDANAAIREENDVVILDDDHTAINLQCSLKNKIIAIIESYDISNEKTKQFIEACLEPDCKNEPTVVEEMIMPHSDSLPSWASVDETWLVKEVALQLDEIDFKRRIESTPMLISPARNFKEINHPLQSAGNFSSTPRITSIAPLKSNLSCVIEDKVTNLSCHNEEIGLSQALDLLSTTPKVATDRQLTIPSTATKPHGPQSAVKNRYISPVIESLAAAFRRKQIAREKEKGENDVNFDLDFDVDCLSADVKKSTQHDDTCEINFDLDFNIEVASQDPHGAIPVASSTMYQPDIPEINVSEVRDENPDETKKTFHEMKTSEEEYIDNSLLKAIEEVEDAVPSLDRTEATVTEEIPVASSTIYQPDIPEINVSEVRDENPDETKKTFLEMKISEEEYIDNSLLKAIAEVEDAVPSLDRAEATVTEEMPTFSTSPVIKAESSFKIPTAPYFQHSRTSVADSPGSPIIRAKVGKRTISKFDDTTPGVIKYPRSSFSPHPSNFEEYTLNESRASTSHDYSVKESPPIVRKKSNKQRGGRMFLETQAAMSGSDDSDEDSCEDRDLSGFVADEHCSPPNTQDHAMYLRMQHENTPRLGPGRFKLVYDRERQNHSAIFSQTPGRSRYPDDDGDEEEIDDSFVVGDDFVEFEEEPAAYVDDDEDFLSPSQPVRRTRMAQKRKNLQKQSRKKRKVVIDDEEDCNQENVGGDVRPAVDDDDNDSDLMLAIQRSIEDANLAIQPASPERNSVFIPGPDSPQILSQTAKLIKKDMNQSLLIPNPTKIAVIVSPRALQSSQPVVSELRADFSSDVHTIIRSSASSSVAGLDFIISCRSAGTRIRLSSLLPPTGNSQTKKRAFEEISNVASVVDFPFVILEDDVPSPSGTNSRSKYFTNNQLSRLLASCSNRKIRILYSRDAAQTASIIVDLARQEDAEGAAVRIDDATFTKLLYNVNPALATGIIAKMRTFECGGGSALTPMVALKLALSFDSLAQFFRTASLSDVLDVAKFSACARQALRHMRHHQSHNT